MYKFLCRHVLISLEYIPRCGISGSYGKVALVVENSLANAEDRFRFDPWLGKIPRRRAWQPTPVFLPGESHGQKSLADHSSWVIKSRTWLKQLSTAQGNFMFNILREQPVSQSGCTILYFHQQFMRVSTSSWPLDSYKTEVILLYNILTLMEFRSSMEAQWYRIHLQCRRLWFNPWVRKIPWRRKWQPTPVFLPGESHGQKSLVGYSPWVAKSQTRFSD